MSFDIGDIEAIIDHGAIRIMADLMALFVDHLDKQPFMMICARCGGQIKADVKRDSGHDLFLEVYPCEHCCGEGEGDD